MADLTRAEVPHIRFILSGTSTLRRGRSNDVFGPPAAIVCGPTMKAGHVAVSAGSVIIAALITPLGWQELLGLPVNELVNACTRLGDLCRINEARLHERFLAARDDAGMFGVADDLFRSLLRERRGLNSEFLGTATQWLLDPNSPSVDELIKRSGLSHRQIDRLCNTYFGAPPKRLHRTFRALNVSTHLAWSGETDWRHVAGDQFYDQSHFIRDFKDIIGCTPGEFVRGPNMMIRYDLVQRLSIQHRDRYSLIG